MTAIEADSAGGRVGRNGDDERGRATEEGWISLFFYKKEGETTAGAA